MPCKAMAHSTKSTEFHSVTFHVIPCHLLQHDSAEEQGIVLIQNNLSKGEFKITATSSKLHMPSSFSYKSITCDTKNNLQCFQSTTKPVLPNLDTPLSQNLYNKLRKGLCRTTTHLSPPSHSDLGTEEALLQKTRLSHLFFPSWGECSFTLFICTIYPPIVFQLYIPILPYPWSSILSPLKDSLLFLFSWIHSISPFCCSCLHS